MQRNQTRQQASVTVLFLDYEDRVGDHLTRLRICRVISCKSDTSETPVYHLRMWRIGRRDQSTRANYLASWSVKTAMKPHEAGVFDL